MTKPVTTDERIFALIDAYGADPDAFPEAERDLARRRMAEAPALFASALKEAALLDGVLDGLPDVDVPAPLPPVLETMVGACAAMPFQSSYWRRTSAVALAALVASACSRVGIRSTAPRLSAFMLSR